VSTSSSEADENVGWSLVGAGRPRTKTRVVGWSCSKQYGPNVKVSQPGAVHGVMIGIGGGYPLLPFHNQTISARRPLSGAVQSPG
jgi:hypothetical protein